MTEKLLQYIWLHQYFNKASLTTIDGEAIVVLATGTLNHNQGPDFCNAQVRIGATLFAGSVELHVKTSQWDEHHHSGDPNYSNVILHVVYLHDAPCHLPVLELESRVPRLLLERYAGLMASPERIACAHAIANVSQLVWQSWKERLLAERLERRAKAILNSLQQNGGHWEACFWWMLAKSFGAKVNGASFELIARSIPLTALVRHKQQIHQVEALLFGQAGLLNGTFTEAYPQLLQREYKFLRKKLQLKTVTAPVYFLRMRPGNFPSLRLAQLAMIIHLSTHLFSKLLETEKLPELRSFFDVTANDYWHYHYRFDEASAYRKKKTGKEMVDSVIINTAVPMVFAYAWKHRDEKLRLKAIRWLEEMDAENNVVVRGFEALGIASTSAFDSQSLLELKSRYCDNRLCLQCAIGNNLLKITSPHGIS